MESGAAADIHADLQMECEEDEEEVGPQLPGKEEDEENEGEFLNG